MAVDPTTLLTAISVGGGLYKSLFPDKIKQIQMDVIENMQDRQKRLMRIARGDWTASERQDIEKGAEPGLNRLAGNLAQRGLGTSGAGAQVMADASILPFTQAQADAEGKVHQLDTSITAALAAIPQQPDILAGFGQLAGKFQMIDKLKMEQAQRETEETGQAVATEPDGVFEGFLQNFMEFLENFKKVDSDDFDLDFMNMDTLGRM